jgi:hypothetical protein
VEFGKQADGFLLRAPDGSMRLVSRVGAVTLRPEPGSHIHLDGSVRIGSRGATCDYEHLGLLRYSRNTGEDGADELLMCGFAPRGEQPTWRSV